MKKCLNCKKTGFFLKLSTRGYCVDCEREDSEILNLSINELSDKLVTGYKSDLKKIERSLVAQKSINERNLKNFNKILIQYNKAREAEKLGNIDKALEIYLKILDCRPEGTDYYKRPCIILEKQKRYQEAIIICDMVIEEITLKHFHADANEFEHRKRRLTDKMSALNNTY